MTRECLDRSSCREGLDSGRFLADEALAFEEAADEALACFEEAADEALAFLAEAAGLGYTLFLVGPALEEFAVEEAVGPLDGMVDWSFSGYGGTICRAKNDFSEELHRR